MLYELAFETTAETAETLAETFSDLEHVLAVSVEDAHVGPDEQPKFGEPGAAIELSAWPASRMVVLLEANTDPARWWQSRCADWPELRQARIDIRAVADQDWVRVTQQQFAPLQIEDQIWVGPCWLTPPDHSLVRHVIRLDPGMAFGTGSHATTQLCLEALLRASRAHGPGMDVLDYGCGSGILAIAASRLGAHSVTALDIDPLAIDATARNAAENQTPLRLCPADEALEGDFDLVIANILSQPLKVLAPLLTRRIRPGGSIILSGILSRQAGEILEVYQPLTAALGGVMVLDERDGWVAIGSPKLKGAAQK